VRAKYTGHFSVEAALPRKQGEATSQEDGQEAERSGGPSQRSHGESLIRFFFPLRVSMRVS